MSRAASSAAWAALTTVMLFMGSVLLWWVTTDNDSASTDALPALQPADTELAAAAGFPFFIFAVLFVLFMVVPRRR